jgi:hypothetical protein
MKTHEKQENQEIGELIREITEKGFTGIVTDVCDDLETRFVAVTVTDYRRLEAGEPDAELTFETSSLIEALRLIVDSIRTQRGEPTLAEEVEAMIYKEQQHESLPPIWSGPDASCRCGSKAHLILERSVKVQIPWDGSQPLLDPVWGILGIAGPVNAGEIARCPDCGHWYQFGA